VGIGNPNPFDVTAILDYSPLADVMSSSPFEPFASGPTPAVARLEISNFNTRSNLVTLTEHPAASASAVRCGLPLPPTGPLVLRTG
jgi:hypothetical protein